MALKDLKSDLSKFRMPKKDPLDKKKVTEVNKKFNQTPLTSRLTSTPEIGKIEKTPTKMGTSPTKFDNSSNFLGETDPSKMDNSSNFLGETDPSKMDNSSNFLGETDASKMDNSSNFLGETDANKFDNSSNFLGETDANKFDNSSNFLGETDANKFDNSSNFLGETDANKFDNSSNFLGETDPSKMDNSSNFLGETDANKFDNSSNFLGETDTSNFTFNPNHESNGKTPSEVNYFSDIHASGFTSKFEGKENTKFIGINPDNTNFDSSNSKYSNFLNSYPGLSFTAGYERFRPIGSYTGDVQRYNPDKKYYIGNQFTNKSISQLQEMAGSPSFLDMSYDKFNLKEDSYNTTFPLFRNPLILSGIQKKGGSPENFGQFGLSFDDGLIRGGVLTSTTRALIDTARIGGWLASPKGLIWGIKQVGLQLSNPNVEVGLAGNKTQIFTPLNMLAAISGQHIGFRPQRHGIIPQLSNPEGYGDVQFSKRIAQSDKGDLAISGLALPTANRLAKLWVESFRTSLSVDSESGNLVGNISSQLGVGAPWLSLQRPGGINTLYGIIPNGQFPRRYVDSGVASLGGFSGFNAIYHYMSSQSPDLSSTKADDLNDNGKAAISDAGLRVFRDNTAIGKNVTENDYKSYNPNYKDANYVEGKGNNIIGTQYDDENKYEEQFVDKTNSDDFKSDTTNHLATIYENIKDSEAVSDNLNADETHKTYNNPFNKKILSDKGSHPIEKLDDSSAIKNYETIAYGNIPTKDSDKKPDFRSLIASDNNVNKKLAELSDYQSNNLYTRVNFGNVGKVGSDRSDWTPYQSNNLNTDRFDKINALKIGGDTKTGRDSGDEASDLVHLWFEPYNTNGGERINFRGTATGISETFSPSWEGIKYNARADEAFKYSSFSRALSFNFLVVATSRVELVPLWNKLQKLSTYTMPVYGGNNGYKGMLIRFRLGDLWRYKLAFIESLSYTYSDEMAWEIPFGSDTSLGEIPKGIDVSVGLKILDDSAPEFDSTEIYDFGKLANWTL